MESNFWTLPEGQKRMLVAQTSERVGLPPHDVEGFVRIVVPGFHHLQGWDIAEQGLACHRTLLGGR